MAKKHRSEPNKVQFNDAALASRIRRLMRGRSKDIPLATAARELLHEYLLNLETHGDPAATNATPRQVPNRAPGSTDAPPHFMEALPHA